MEKTEEDAPDRGEAYIGRLRLPWRSALLTSSLIALVLGWLGLALPASANDVSRRHFIPVSAPATVSPDLREALPHEAVVPEAVLADQRGSGASAVVPLLTPVPQPQGIILWDEAKPPQPPNVTSGAGQAVNQIQVR